MASPVLTIVDTRGEYRRAYEWYLVAQGECPHWDYDTPEGMQSRCCVDMAEALTRVKQIRAKLTRLTR